MDELESYRSRVEAMRLACLDQRAEFEEARMRLEQAQEEYTAALETYHRALRRTLPGSRDQSNTGEDPWLEPGEDIRSIVMQLGALNKGARLEARHLLDRMGPKAVAPLLRLLGDENRQHLTRLKAAALICVIAIAHSITQLTETFPAGGILSQYANVIMLVLVGCGVLMAKPSRGQRLAGLALSAIEDPKAAGALVEAYEVADESGRETIGKALQRMFPRLHASDAQHLTKSHMQGVLRLLEVDDADLAIAILQGLEQIGDREAVEKVEAIARGRGAGARSRRVREAASQCLPALLDRRVGSRGADILLRPAEGAEPPERLLRAASPVAPPPDEALLRVAPKAPAEGPSI